MTLETTTTQVETVRAERRDFSLVAEATGHLLPWRQVEIGAEASGRVVWHGLEEGRPIAAGAILLQLDDRDRHIELAEAEAELLRVLANFAVFTSLDPESVPADVEVSPAPNDTEDNYRNAQELFEEGLIAQNELTQARRAHEIAEMLSGERQVEVRAATTGLTQAEQRLEKARLALARTRLIAPFAGRVADLEIEVGQQVNAGEPCLRLIDESRFTVEVEVLEDDVVWLRPGSPARVRIPALADRTLPGRVHHLNPKIDTETGTARVTVLLENAGGRLMPGLFAFVDLETQLLHDRLVVPEEAVLSRQGHDLVFLVEDGKSLWTYVKLGRRSGDWVEIVDGLAAGTEIAVSGHFALAHGSRVEARPRREGEGS
jgi:HlyD family secretion protein